MSTEQLTADAMALPLLERVALAQALWSSINGGLGEADERAVLSEVVRRDEELSSGAAVGRTHGEVMDAARRSIGCD